ncbi:hypothetical protein [Bacillus sp. CHD6a]|nr:hypothetical protein [Bacillus sp. CHD6a]
MKNKKKPFWGLPFSDVKKMLDGTWAEDEELKKKLETIRKENKER